MQPVVCDLERVYLTCCVPLPDTSRLLLAPRGTVRTTLVRNLGFGVEGLGFEV